MYRPFQENSILHLMAVPTVFSFDVLYGQKELRCSLFNDLLYGCSMWCVVWEWNRTLRHTLFLLLTVKTSIQTGKWWNAEIVRSFVQPLKSLPHFHTRFPFSPPEKVEACNVPVLYFWSMDGGKLKLSPPRLAEAAASYFKWARRRL